MAGARRDRESTAKAAGVTAAPAPTDPAPANEANPEPSATKPSGTKPSGTKPSGKAASGKAASGKAASGKAASGKTASGKTAEPPVAATTPVARRRFPVLALTLALLCLAAAVGVGLLLWQRAEPRYVDAGLLSATRANVQDLYAYDYEDSEGSVRGKLAVLTGELREQYETELGEGGIIDVYEQVSATTRYEVADVGLQQVNDSQDTATLVVFGSYVVQSATTGQEPAPEGSECQVTPEGAQSCVQTLQVRATKIDGDWKISELVLLTTS